MGSRCTGRQKELQYCARWKGYSASHDSWEPAGNVNAPELIKAFHKRNLNQDKRRGTISNHPSPHISFTTLHQITRMTDTHPMPPSETPPPLPSLPPSEQPSPTIAQIMLTMADNQDIDVTQTRVNLMTHELQRDLEPEVPNEEQNPLDDYVYAPRSPTLEHSPEDVYPRGPIQLGTEPIPPPLPHHLLWDEPGHPGWLFMAPDCYPESASINPVIDSQGTLGILDYTRLSINRISGEPISVITEGRDQPQYAGNLYAQPVPPMDSNKWPIPEGSWETSPLGEQMALDPILNRALWTIKDAGIWADVFRYRYEDGRQREFRAWEMWVNKLEQFAKQEHHAYSTAQEESLRHKAQASNRLLAAHAMSKACNFIQNWEGPEDFNHCIEWMRHTKWIPLAVVVAGGLTRNKPGQLSRSVHQCSHKKQSKCHYCGLYGHTGDAPEPKACAYLSSSSTGPTLEREQEHPHLKAWAMDPTLPKQSPKA